MESVVHQANNVGGNELADDDDEKDGEEILRHRQLPLSPLDHGQIRLAGMQEEEGEEEEEEGEEEEEEGEEGEDGEQAWC